MVGVTLIAQGLTYLLEGTNSGFYIPVIGLLMLVSGAALVAGFMTPVAGFLAMIAGVCSILALFPAITPNFLDGKTAAINVIAISAAILCIGPGSVSVDARLFGRREIIISASRPTKS